MNSPKDRAYKICHVCQAKNNGKLTQRWPKSYKFCPVCGSSNFYLLGVIYLKNVVANPSLIK